MRRNRILDVGLHNKKLAENRNAIKTILKNAQTAEEIKILFDVQGINYDRDNELNFLMFIDSHLRHICNPIAFYHEVLIKRTNWMRQYLDTNLDYIVDKTKILRWIIGQYTGGHTKDRHVYLKNCLIRLYVIRHAIDFIK